MQRPEPKDFFGKEQAAKYDQQFAKMAPIRDSLHLLISAIFVDLPANARILCVGAGTGAEILYLAHKFPGWHFTAVEPSAPMLDICRQRTEESGIASRCDYHEGYLDSLPATQPFDAATSLLVSHFILDTAARTAFFRAIADRLHPGGLLATADLASDTSTATYQSLLNVWMRLMQGADIPEEKLEQMRTAYGRDVAILPLEEVSTLITSGGFEKPVLFHQTGLIHGWYARAQK